jgi:hypothetical protein
VVVIRKGCSHKKKVRNPKTALNVATTRLVAKWGDPSNIKPGSIVCFIRERGFDPVQVLEKLKQKGVPLRVLKDAARQLGVKWP